MATYVYDIRNNVVGRGGRERAVQRPECFYDTLLAACGGGGASESGSTIVAAPVSPAPTPPPPEQPTIVGCQSKSNRLPWGQAQLRTWTPKATAEPAEPDRALGSAFGAPFQARLILAYGEDYGASRRTVLLEAADGCRRQYRAESFSDADQTVIADAMAQHPLIPDTASYRLTYRSGMTSPELVEQGKLKLHQTQHFAIWYGTNTQSELYVVAGRQGRTADQVAQDTGEWLEKQWLINRDILNAPMPYANSADRRKVDVFFCGSGRPLASTDDLRGCGNNAAEYINLSMTGLEKGSPIIVHEFGHVIQFYSGDFRDKGDAGVIWETGAEWNSFAVTPSYYASYASYLNQLENSFLFSPARYGANPIFTYLFEQDKTRDLVFGTWLNNLRTTTGATTEDYFQAFVRLAKEKGIYPNGYASFAEDIGWYGARLVTMDFFNQRAMADALRVTRTTTRLANFYTPLAAASTSDPTLFAPPSKRPLLQWGTHIVPLTTSDQQVTVTLKGDTTSNQAAWRFTLVSVAADGTPAYARMTTVEGRASASVRMAPQAGAKMYLVVSATPYVYETLGWQENGKPVKGTRFPYTVKIEGATPRTGSQDACDPNVEFGGWTLNYTLSGDKETGRACT